MFLSDNHIVIVVFRLITLIIVFFNAKYISTTKSNNFLSFTPSIVIYSLYSGLRWGRGQDYNTYYYLYNDIVKGDVFYIEDQEPLFVLFCKLFGFLGLEWSHFVFFMSFFLIFSICFLLKNRIFLKYLPYIMPLLVMRLDLAETLSRWYFALSFIIIGLSFLISNRKIHYFTFVCIAFFVHYATILISLAVFVVWLSYKKVRLSFICISIIYLLLFFLFNEHTLSFFDPILSNLNIERYKSYTDSSELWLGGKEDFVKGVSLSQLLPALFYLYAGSKFSNVKNAQQFVFFFYCGCICLFLDPISKYLELFIRFKSSFDVMRIICLSIILYNCISFCKKNKFMYYASILYFSYLVVTSIFMVLNYDSQMTLYLWDSEGKNVNPYIQ